MKQWWQLQRWPLLILSALYWRRLFVYVAVAAQLGCGSLVLARVIMTSACINRIHRLPVVVPARYCIWFFGKHRFSDCRGGVWIHFSGYALSVCYRLWQHQWGAGDCGDVSIQSVVLAVSETALTYTIDAAASITWAICL